MPLFKRTLSEFIFRRFMLRHYASNIPIDMYRRARKSTLGYAKAHTVAVRGLRTPGFGR